MLSPLRQCFLLDFLSRNLSIMVSEETLISPLLSLFCCLFLFTKCQLLSSVRLQPHGLKSTRLLCPWTSPGKNTWVDSYFFLQGIFLTQGSSPGLPYCRWILYQLSYQGKRFYWRKVFKNQDLSTGCAHCYWDITTSCLLSMFCQLSRSRYHSPSPRMPTTSQRDFPSSKPLECRRQ